MLLSTHWLLLKLQQWEHSLNSFFSKQICTSKRKVYSSSCSGNVKICSLLILKWKSDSICNLEIMRWFILFYLKKVCSQFFIFFLSQSPKCETIIIHATLNIVLSWLMCNQCTWFWLIKCISNCCRWVAALHFDWNFTRRAGPTIQKLHWQDS